MITLHIQTVDYCRGFMRPAYSLALINPYRQCIGVVHAARGDSGRWLGRVGENANAPRRTGTIGRRCLRNGVPRTDQRDRGKQNSRDRLHPFHGNNLRPKSLSRERPDAGRGELRDGSASGEDLQALADVVTEQVQVQSAKGGRQRVEAAERGGEQARDSEGIVATLVFQRGGDLNDALQEGLLRLRRREPDTLPGFVGGKELASSVAAQAFGERAPGPIELHRVSVTAARLQRSGNDISGRCEQA